MFRSHPYPREWKCSRNRIVLVGVSFDNLMHGFSSVPLTQFSSRHRISRCRNQVILWRNRAAISCSRQYVENQPNSESSSTVFASAPNFERFASYSGLDNLGAKWAREIQHATESGAELVGSGNAVHDKYLLS
jgi:hypothetical protein